MKVIQPAIFAAATAALLYCAYKAIRDAIDNPPPTEYHPEDINAEIFMADNPNYPDFEMMWDETPY